MIIDERVYLSTFNIESITNRAKVMLTRASVTLSITIIYSGLLLINRGIVYELSKALRYV
jgi:hypothetical protein